MKENKFITKIFEIKRNNFNKTRLLKVVNIIKRENNYSILSKLSKELIIEYLIIAAHSKKLFLFVIQEKNKIIGYSLYAENEDALTTEFKKMKYKIFWFLLSNGKIISMINIFFALSKLDLIFVNFFKKKETKKILNLNLLAIEKKYQSKGLGKHFIEKTLKYLQKSGLRFSYVSCEAPNIRALKFYKQNNFKLVGKKIRLFKNLFLLKRKVNEL